MKHLLLALACTLAGCSTLLRPPADCEGDLVPINVASSPAPPTSSFLRFLRHAARSGD